MHLRMKYEYKIIAATLCPKQRGDKLQFIPTKDLTRYFAKNLCENVTSA